MSTKLSTKSKGPKALSETPSNSPQNVQIVQGAKGKTESLKRHTLPVDLLVPNEENPNEMSEQEFNLLYDNVERMGITDPILVRHHPGIPGKYKIVGGHHRVEVAKLHGLDEVPVTLITDPEFDDEMEKFQMVRHNIIHGKMNPQKFMNLYQSLQGKYSEDVAAELFGFSNEDEFKKLVQLTAKALPKEMKQSFVDASKEIKTIDDLATVLNRLFSTYGDTVPYGYMIFDFGGNDHVWLRLKKNQKKHLSDFGDLCRKHNRSVDAGMAAMLESVMAGGDFEELLLKHPEVTLSGDEDKLQTEDFLASFATQL